MIIMATMCQFEIYFKLSTATTSCVKKKSVAATICRSPVSICPLTFEFISYIIYDRNGENKYE